MTILIVEDDRDIGSLLRRGLVAEEYEVELVSDGEAALDVAGRVGAFEAIILDVMLPGQSGIEVCRALRSAGHTAPIIMLSARSSVNERTEGLLAGADDYVVKPFVFEELLARVRVQAMRRTSDEAEAKAQVVRAGQFSLDLGTRVLTMGEDSLRLTERESELLALLMRNAGRPLARGDIFSALWADHGGASLNVVDVYIGYLRHKMAEAFPDVDRPITTVRGRGFMLVAPE